MDQTPPLKIKQNRLDRLILPEWTAPLILFVACFLAFALMIPWLGFYSDDWVFLSTYHKMGSEGLSRYFSTNRPFWGLFFQVTLPVLGKLPWVWHLFGLAWHWIAAASFWWMMRLVWPNKKNAALWGGLLFAVYPGFVLQPIALSIGHMFFVYTSFLLSINLFLLAYLKPGKFWLFTPLALLFSLINMMSMEYFMLMHVLQPVFLFMILSKGISGWRSIIKQVAMAWLPYFILLVVVLFWRIFLFPYQNQNYSFLFIDRLKDNPISALLFLFKTMTNDWYEAGLGAWFNAIRLPFTLHWERLDFLYLTVVLLGILVLAFLIAFYGKRSRNHVVQTEPQERTKNIDGWQMIASGALAMLIAGVPFWITEIPVGLEGFHTRFMLPFIFGMALILSGFLELVPAPFWSKVVMLSVILGLGIGFQFQSQNDFRREWIVQKSLYWQLAWRIPDLTRGTIVFSSELPVKYNASDYTQSAMFDWLWAPLPSAQVMDYALYYPNERLLFGDLLALTPDTPIIIDHLGAVFKGNTNQSITVQLNDPEVMEDGCLHVMLPKIDFNNPYYPRAERDVITFSDPELIKANDPDETRALDPAIFGPEPSPDHCYFFEKADLAFQLGNWIQAIEYYNQSLSAGFDTWRDTELLPVIGSYAHLGDWNEALTLTQRMSKKAFYPIDAVICNLWREIDQSTDESVNKEEALSKITTKFQCDP